MQSYTDFIFEKTTEKVFKNIFTKKCILYYNNKCEE